MEYRKLGRTNLKVSEIALGCEGFSGRNIWLLKIRRKENERHFSNLL